MQVTSLSDTVELAPSPISTDAPPEPISSRIQVDMAARSHTGLVRPNNEDSFLISRLKRTLETLSSNLPSGRVPDIFEEVIYGYVVADGIGGGKAGEVAGRLAISSLVNLVLSTPSWIMRPGNDEVDSILERMAERFRNIGQIVTGRAEEGPGLTGMGTTLTVGCSIGSDLFLGHVGDSRVYVLRGGQLTQLTKDHTVAQALADLGHIQPDEVATHPYRHVLTRAVGRGGGKVEADVGRYELHDGDRLLFCTDGLHDLVPDAAIADLLSRAESAATASETLVEAALAAGGKDNITVAVAFYCIPPG